MRVPTILELLRSGWQPRLHPNGFIQLDIGNHRRLHIWPQPPVPAQKTRHTIHDHCFSMRSSVILGHLTHIEYDFNELVRPCHGARHICMLHRAEKIGGEDTVLKPASPIGWLSRRRLLPVAQGFGYGFGPMVLHDSVPKGLTATIMTKTFVDPKYRPLVAVPYGVEPDNDFRRDTMSRDALWQIIDKVLDVANKRY